MLNGRPLLYQFVVPAIRDQKTEKTLRQPKEPIEPIVKIVVVHPVDTHTHMRASHARDMEMHAKPQNTPIAGAPYLR